MLPATQRAMLLVKSSIEHNLNEFVNHHLQTDVSDTDRVTNFFADVERFAAFLFASRQIDNNYIVRPSSQGVEVTFTTNGQYSRTTYLLPEQLRWTVEKMIPRAVKMEVHHLRRPLSDEEAYLEYVDHAKKHTDVNDMEFIEFDSSHAATEDRFGHLTKAEEDNLKQVLINGVSWSVLPNEVI